MNKLIITVLLCIFATNTYAQSDKTKTSKRYVEVYAWFKASTPTIDTGEGKGKETYTTEEGKVISFHSAIGAVNWFVSNGWELVSEHMSTCNDRSVKMYVLSKDVPLQDAQKNQDKYIKKP